MIQSEFIKKMTCMLIILTSISGCATTRMIGFPPLSATEGNNKYIFLAIHDFEFRMESSRPKKEKFINGPMSLQNRFREQLDRRGIMTVTDTPPTYSLTGSFLVREDAHRNAWSIIGLPFDIFFAGSPLLILVGWKLGLLGIILAPIPHLTIPAFTMEQFVVFEAELVNTISGKVIYNKKQPFSADTRYNRWQRNNKLNKALSEVCDKALAALAEEVSVAISDSDYPLSINGSDEQL